MNQPWLRNRWNFVESPQCQCGQVLLCNIVENYPIHRFHGTIKEIHNVTKEAMDKEFASEHVMNKVRDFVKRFLDHIY